MADAQTIRVALAIVVRVTDGLEVLIARRPATTIRPGAWEFPGGKIEPDETPAEVAVRETLEELALSISVSHTLAPHTHTYTHATVELHPCIARLDPPDQTPTLLAADAVDWVDPAVLPVPGFLEGNTPILAGLLDHLRTVQQ